MTLDDLLADIGDRFRAERQARNISQIDFAKQFSFSVGTVKRVEQGLGVSMDTYYRMCQALQVPFLYMMSSDWRMPKRIPKLGPYQLKVLESVAKGGSLSEVGKRIGLTAPAVGSALHRIYQNLEVPYKYGVDRKKEAVRIAREYGLIMEAVDGETDG